MICTIEELCRKDVINIHNGKRLGMVCDCEIIIESGTVSALLVMPAQPIFSFKRNEPFRVEWSCISVIGDETILINCECVDRKTHEKKNLFLKLFG